MGKLTNRARAKADYAWFIGSREWPVFVSALGVLLGVVTLVPSAVGIVLSVIALALGLVTLVRDVRLLRGRWAAYEFTVIAAPFPHVDVPPPASYPGARYLELPGRGTGLVSDAVDRALWTAEFPVDVAADPYHLPAELKATAPHVLPLRAHGRLLFNGTVVGMRGEPLPSVGRGAPIRLHRTRFFDGQCSNELATLRVSRRDTGVVFDLRRRMMVDAAGRLRTLAESPLADIVGVSTVAVTTDGWVLLVVQSNRNSASQSLLAPSGSGSLEPRDLVGDDLHDVMRAGMERELCEETGLRRSEITRTTVVGFARWMERGAKPEFFGLTELSVTRQELVDRRPSRAERDFTSAVRFEKIDLDAFGRELAAGADLFSPALPELIHGSGSVPLLLGLRAGALWKVGAQPSAGG
ncbi:hypothetical protein [Amycolatopsis thermophila]|uniref:8-oxo-dGTP pyrophosphatase MutT (NUDIX family) n=1 Tax=Amycolatopsis thermophila TaxID=206084 RepID=A0ABU0EUP4_9PSEU|nr:hypothetical protein [Amycolatopsis thermophila]MDQ0378517.1 8-oxo-dGTP pyrophosphatase MutT (NUDIX family) [Amycolatopsis thermophila]